MSFKSKIKSALLLSFFTQLAVTVNAETIHQSVEEAIRTNPNILENVHNIEAIRSELKQAHGRRKPQVSASVGVDAGISDLDGNRYSQSPNGFGSDGRLYDDQGSRTYTSSEASITMTQRIWDGGETSAQLKRDAARVDASALRLKERSEFIALQVINAYLENLRQQETLELAKANVDKHKYIINQLQSASALASAANTAQANNRLARAQEVYVGVTRDLEEQALIFESLVGRKPGTLKRPSISTKALPANIDEAVQMAFDKNPTILFSQADVDTALAELKSIEASYYPNLNLQVKGSVENDSNGVPGTTRSATVGLVGNWDIYTGGIRDARYEEYRNRVHEAEEILHKAYREAEFEVKTTWDELLRLNARIETLEREEVYAKEVVVSYSEEFQTGTRDLLDVLQAENDLFVSRSNLIESRYSVLFNRYKLLAATGNLLDNLGLQPLDNAFYQERQKYGVAYTDDLKMYRPKD